MSKRPKGKRYTSAFSIFLQALPAVHEFVRICKRGGDAKVFASPSGCYCVEVINNDKHMIDDPRVRPDFIELLDTRSWNSLPKRTQCYKEEGATAFAILVWHKDMMCHNIQIMLDRMEKEAGNGSC